MHNRIAYARQMKWPKIRKGGAKTAYCTTGPRLCVLNHTLFKFTSQKCSGGKMRHTLKQAGERINCGKRLNKHSLGVKLEFLLCRFRRDRRCCFSRENSWLNKPRKDVKTGSVWQTAKAGGSESRTVARHESKGQNVCVMCDGGAGGWGSIGARSLFMSDWQE